MNKITVVDYDPRWALSFQHLHSQIWPAIQDIALAIEHVGSTSVPGLAAKPVIDMSIVVASAHETLIGIERLAALGYEHLGDLGVKDREAFKRPDGMAAHNLYICLKAGQGLRNHLAVRDYLRAHPETARAYGELKKRLAAQFPNDIDSYVEGKTAFILAILRKQGFLDSELAEIDMLNRKE